MGRKAPKGGTDPGRVLSWRHGNRIADLIEPPGVRPIDPEIICDMESKHSSGDKLTIYNVILNPTWAYGIELWGSARKSNIDRIQVFQSKILDTPCYLDDLRELQLPQFVIDAEFHSSPALPPLAVIIVCALLLLAIILIATALVWKHKKKMQNFLPCKSSPQNHCDVAHGNGVIYEDLTNIRPRPLPQPSMEMLDVKARGIEMAYHSPVFICPPAPPHSRPLPSHQYCSQDLYNPVYEELSNGK
ncbi:hypothetical protein AAG570_007923 [Ranatra chinensis]|uniref:Uncharacterized protein n=1 Tax=Ranatra chinensis TaxID=642074 RepID=A0ABD0XT81_9HEMI